jgi:ABC-type phosphate transport system permease subunit
MAVGKGPGSKWSILILAIILGTMLGVYMQGFQATESLFRDVTRAGFDLHEMDLIFGTIGFKVFLRLNLGSLLGGLFGLWIIR